jgi:hypothetical protein
MKSDTIRISTDNVIRDGEREVEQERRQRQDQHHQDRHHADNEPDVAPAKHGAEIDQARQRRLIPFGRSCVGHSCRLAPSIAVARLKGLLGGWRAAGENEWSRARVQG